MVLINALRAGIPHGVRKRLSGSISHWLQLLGFDPLAELRPVDFSGIGLPVEEVVLRASGIPFIIDVPVGKMRILHAVGWSCSRKAGNPFVETVVDYLEGRCCAYPGSALQRFYEDFQPESVAAVLGMESDGSEHFLLKQCALLHFFPWAKPPLQDYSTHLRQRRANILADNKKHGGTMDFKSGYYAWGPVSNAKGQLEFDRLIRVAESILRDGFKTFSGVDAARAYVLKSGTENRYLCQCGNHRLAAYAALGAESFPIWPYSKIIDRAEASSWKGVEAGIFTIEQANRVFDRIFEGQGIPIHGANEPAEVRSELDAFQEPRPLAHRTSGSRGS